MTTTGEVLTNRALELYKPPFSFKSGYFYDADGKMVADKHEGEVMRVRGWGRISYKEDAEALQDEVGRLIAKAMTDLWSAPQGNAAQEGYVLVPVEPTSEMLSDGWRAAVGKHDHAALAHIYKTMIAAPSNKEVER